MAEQVQEKDLLSTGSTTLNLACSGNAKGGFAKGHYYFMVGDSSAGKTFLGLTCLAEAMLDEEFSDYRIVYDAPEGGALMDIERFFGKAVASRLESPYENGDSSHVVEEFYFNLDHALKGDAPCIYILDSQDCLGSKADESKFKDEMAAFDRGKDTTGQMSDGKAKVHSRMLRRVMGPLQKSRSILIILNQTRDNIGNMFQPKTYSGGHSLLFYATLQLWLSVGGQIKKKVREKERQTGIQSRIRVKKNRITGRDRTIHVPIYHSVGIDDVGGCVDYLVTEKQWRGVKGKGIKATGIGPEIVMPREKLIRYIEQEELEEDVRELVQQVWEEVEAGLVVERKRRYE